MVEPLELGRFISTCRKEKNLTQKAAGRRTGRDRQSCVKMGEWSLPQQKDIRNNP